MFVSFVWLSGSCNCFYTNRHCLIMYSSQWRQPPKIKPRYPFLAGQLFSRENLHVQCESVCAVWIYMSNVHRLRQISAERSRRLIHRRSAEPWGSSRMLVLHLQQIWQICGVQGLKLGLPVTSWVWLGLNLWCLPPLVRFIMDLKSANLNGGLRMPLDICRPQVKLG